MELVSVPRTLVFDEGSIASYWNSSLTKTIWKISSVFTFNLNCVNITVKVNLSMCLTKHWAMKTYGGLQMEMSSQQRALGTHWIEGSVGPKGGVICLASAANRTPIARSSSPYTDWAVERQSTQPSCVWGGGHGKGRDPSRTAINAVQKTGRYVAAITKEEGWLPRLCLWLVYKMYPLILWWQFPRTSARVKNSYWWGAYPSDGINTDMATWQSASQRKMWRIWWWWCLVTGRTFDLQRQVGRYISPVSETLF
jgi:hypothetical protein